MMNLLGYLMKQNIKSINGDFTDYSINKEYEYASNRKSKGFTPLMYLLITGQFDVIERNIDNLKTWINNTNEKGWTVLLIACRNSRKLKCLHIIKLLLDYGANVDHESNDNWTALTLSAGNSNRDSNIETVKLLLNNGANINYKTSDGWTALMISARNSNKESNIETVKLLLDYEAGGRWTALILSAKNSNGDSNVETVKLLLDNGANINYETSTGWTPLMISARNSNKNSNVETIKLLLDSGANINHKTKDGWTALLIAAKHSHVDSNIGTVKLLLNYGADPHIKNNNNYDTFMMTEYNKELIPILDQWKKDQEHIKLIKINIHFALIELKFHYTKWMYNDESLRIKLLSYKGKKFNYDDKFINTIFAINNQDQLDARIKELDIINTEKLTLYRQFRKH